MVYAIDISDPTINPVAKFGNIGSILSIVLPLITIFSAVVVLIMFLMGGYSILTGGGDPAAIKKAQGIFTFAVLGLFLIIFSMFLVKLIASVLNVPIPF